MNRSTLDDLLGGMDNGGFPVPPHKDGHAGLGYSASFDPMEVGRSGNEVLNVFNDMGAPNPHFDVIEKNRTRDVLHHRIYDPFGGTGY